MIDEFKNFYARFNYNEANGFICTLPTGKQKEHLSIGFDNKRKEFNIHFTDDSIIEKGVKRRNFIFVISAFRFFLIIRRIELFYLSSFLNLVLSSKINLGRLKKHKLMIYNIEDSIDVRNKLFEVTKNGKKWKFNSNLNTSFFTDSLEPISNLTKLKNDFTTVYKWKKQQLSLQGFILKLDDVKGLYFIPLKKLNQYNRRITINIYNYLNSYPSESTLELRKILYDRLKNPNDI
ncbi:hypothetical protein FHS04_001295 [Mesoflavibacter sabulilitoris]|uniref:Uncharacterized protein n=1 Tax=Mesoflavibacter zeaxanthinifaciens subsp. sabulilitoris TaxID=1520893 RepID=A0A2T1NAD1_9FLAO|nr:hypothetical protein [Mesoflavibacter zeaxanthinifaciens]MBB3123792.1 hypothetical protein [Mesoflavibacter zeaxanthinifaciens subsp. sabulilitoris]PSG89090.1 hypothetical protein C7H61_09025 [Mesoflavibacter zeaxanthinifaciens subsp. sabulilitoris]